MSELQTQLQDAGLVDAFGQPLSAGGLDEECPGCCQLCSDACVLCVACVVWTGGC